MTRLIPTLGALTFAVAAYAQTPPTNNLTMGPDFVKTAAASDAFERASGEIAAERGQMAQVKSFGQMMATAHAQTSKDLAMAAEAAGVGAPRPELTPGHEKMLMMLRSAPAAMFDKLYLQQQHEAHMDALGLMQSYARLGKEAPLRAAAAKTAPLVQSHLDQIKTMQRSLR